MICAMKKLLRIAPLSFDAGLLIFRIMVGVCLFIKRGWLKFAPLDQVAPKFPDPFYVGVKLTIVIALISDALGSVLGSALAPGSQRSS
jgi:hypothetical protein